MSIRFKILFGCLSLTLITVVMGGFTQRAQEELGVIATRIYDEAFMAVSYLREAQNGLMKLNLTLDRLEAGRGSVVEPGADVETAALLAEAVPEILGSLQVAQERAMSVEGEQATAALRTEIEALGTGAGGMSFPTLITDLDHIQRAFDTAVEIYAGDGYRYRQSVGRNIEASSQRTWLVVSLSVVIAFLITFLLTRSISPALRDVVRIAKAIAAGHLDNIIVSRDSSETGQMLQALAAMQGSIASSLARINALMAEEASSHAGEMAIQHGRFEAALDNMTQGLCLFDSAGRLTIFNRRFGEMFGEAALGTDVHAILSREGLQPPADLTETPSFLRDLPDGRIIAVAHRRVEGGGWVATYEDVTERRRVEARFAYMARHDALTGLPNRVLFREHMEEALLRGRGKAFSLLSLDLDGFKAINDTLGHPTGDALLQAVAKRLLDCAPDADIVARLGGDEFVVIQEEAAPGDIPALAQRLVEAMHAPFQLDVHQLVIGVSIGIASSTDLADPAAAGTPDTLLKKADLALYRAKWDGRGTFRFFEAEMDARLQARRSLEFDLQSALDREQFELLYQPLVDTRRGHVAGFEALLRWHHPERGTVSPAEFIPVAEEMGLIKAIGAWVLEQACGEAATWPDHVKIAVNLSPVQFSAGNVVEIVSRALAVSGLQANRLELEITESLLLQDTGAVLETLHQLRKLGTRIAMDDFGTGYSSLSYLQRFPFDKIKIDQTFIRQLSDKSDSTAIVRAVIGLGKSLGIAILAEGVETAEQLAILQAEGCWVVQGYLFSPPRPASDAPELIRSIGADQAIPARRSDKARPAA
jgi:diguanylate cyclase (GGDEF)-like protein